MSTPTTTTVKYRVLYSKDAGKKRMVFHDGVLLVRHIDTALQHSCAASLWDGEENSELKKENNFKPKLTGGCSTELAVGDEIVFGPFTIQIDSLISSSSSAGGDNTSMMLSQPQIKSSSTSMLPQKPVVLPGNTMGGSSKPPVPLLPRGGVSSNTSSLAKPNITVLPHTNTNKTVGSQKTAIARSSQLDSSDEEEQHQENKKEIGAPAPVKKQSSFVSPITSGVNPLPSGVVGGKRAFCQVTAGNQHQPMKVPTRPSTAFVNPNKSAIGQSIGASSAEPIVKVDNFLLRSMKIHQIEGAEFILRALTGRENLSSSTQSQYETFNTERSGSNSASDFNSKVRGVILADEMGLGKTLTTISILYAFAQAEVCKSIVVTPSTLIDNWSKEIKKWLGMRVSPIVIKSGSDGNASINTFSISRISRYPILLISYEMIRKYVNELNRVPKLDLIVCDEGHRLKNTETKTMESLSLLKATKRIVLTGTPVQNNLDEFYSLLSYIAPTKTMSYNDLRSALEDTGSDLLSGIFLRRTQQEVLSKILPPRVDVIIRFPLSERHAQIYDTMVETVIDSLQDGTNATNNRVLPALLSLRKVCCTGDVTVSGASEAMGNFKQASSIYKGSSNIDATISHKLLILERLIHHIHTQYPDDKIVIVSGSMEHLDAITDRVINKNGWGPVSRIDGSVPGDKRQSLVDTFNMKSNKNVMINNGFIMLLSTKAGGVGINLVGANRLIMADLDWNPAHDKQAMNRIWRPGQTKTAYIYRLIAIGTIEDSMLMRQNDKSSLENIFDSTRSDSKSSSMVNDPASQRFQELAYPEGQPCCEVVESIMKQCSKMSVDAKVAERIKEDQPLRLMYLELSKKFPVLISFPDMVVEDDSQEVEDEVCPLWEKEEVDFYAVAEDEEGES